jgi:2-amino-4-hydroxy-6-hydroxymethyldihydropteridine diphosphokinase
VPNPPGIRHGAAVSYTIAIALGSNLGDRARNLRAAIDALRGVVRVVRISRVRETDPVDAPPGSPKFLNMAIAGYTSLSPEALLDALLDIERRLGRRRGIRNAPRTIDLDLIFHSANVRRTPKLTLPHPRYRERTFVLEPLREVWGPRYRVP